MKEHVKKIFWSALIFLPIMIFLTFRFRIFLSDYKKIEIGEMTCMAISLGGAIMLFFFLDRIKKYFCSIADDLGIVTAIVYLFSFFFLMRFKIFEVNAIKNFFLEIVFFLGGGLLLGSFLLHIIVFLVAEVKRISIKKQDVFFVVASVAVINALVITYAYFQKEIFVWDNAGYFTLIHQLVKIFPSKQLMVDTYNSIINLDYNYLIALPGVVISYFFGSSRLVFLLFIANCYLVPFWCILYFYADRKLMTSSSTLIFALLAFPMIQFMTNTGFVDVGGLIFCTLAVILYFENRTEDTPGFLVIGILLGIAVILRRWYSFFALAMIITSFIFNIKNIKKPIFILMGFAFFLGFFFQRMVTGKLLADYGQMYAAYNLGIKTDFLLFVRYFGLIVPILCVVFAFFPRTLNAKFLLTLSIVCFFVFTRVQTHGQQHLLLYVPTFALIYLMILNRFWSNKRIVTGFMVLSAACTLNTFMVRYQPATISEISKIAALPDFSVYPKRRADTGEILRLVDYLDLNVGAKGKTACVLSSSLMLNYDTIKNAKPSLNEKQTDEMEYLIPISQVDRRDGFSKILFSCDYVVVPTPMQLHLQEEEQQVISMPYNYIMKSGSYKKLTEEFKLNGIMVYIYEKIGNIPEEKIEEFSKIQ